MGGVLSTGLSVSTQTATAPGGAEATVLAFEGDLDLATIPVFEEALDAVPDAPLVLDLGGLRFIDSSGIHCLVRARTARVERGLGVALAIAAGSSVERVLEMSGLLDVLAPRPDREDALAALDS